MNPRSCGRAQLPHKIEIWRFKFCDFPERPHARKRTRSIDCLLFGREDLRGNELAVESSRRYLCRGRINSGFGALLSSTLCQSARQEDWRTETRGEISCGCVLSSILVRLLPVSIVPLTY